MSARQPISAFRRERALAAARQPTTLAFLVALGVTALLALLVLGPWAGGGSAGQDADATRLAAVGSPGAGGPTPTPRALRIGASRSASPPASPAAETAPAIGAEAENDARDAGQENQLAIAPRTAERAEPTEPPRPTATRPPRPEPTATATATPEPTPLAELAVADGLRSLATASWQLDADQLLHTGLADAEPWIVVPETPPDGDFAVEAEFRVRELNPGVCAQSFGIVAGDPSRTVWGGGMFYPCAQAAGGPVPRPRARLTDVTNPIDGYNGDTELDSGQHELDEGWHAFRLEVRGDGLRLLIDGEEVATADIERGQPGPAEQVGFWSQGVRVGIRRFAIYELPVNG